MGLRNPMWSATYNFCGVCGYVGLGCGPVRKAHGTSSYATQFPSGDFGSGEGRYGGIGKASSTRLINQGLSLKEICDHLGQRDVEATRIYAKVDLVRLREVANFDLGERL
jgi:hypothetical protein